MIGESLSGLMDRAVGVEDHMRIRDIISANSKGAIEVHDLKTRIAGRATFIEFHLVVDADMTVGESHVICDRIEEALTSRNPLGARHHPCRAGRRGQAAARHARRALRLRQLDRSPGSGHGPARSVGNVIRRSVRSLGSGRRRDADRRCRRTHCRETRDGRSRHG